MNLIFVQFMKLVSFKFMNPVFFNYVSIVGMLVMKCKLKEARAKVRFEGPAGIAEGRFLKPASKEG